MKRPEQALQRAVFLHLRMRPAPGVVAWHTPNGGFRNKREAAIFKALGVLAGIPDVLAVRDRQLYALELKVKGGRLSEAQLYTHAVLEAAGAVVGTATGLDAALTWLEGHGLLRGARQCKKSCSISVAARAPGRSPYREAGYDVRLVTLRDDVRQYQPPTCVHGILAAPPCTEFAVSGARWWSAKPPELLAEAIEVARACLRIIKQSSPAWWALENPIGRIASCVPELGKPKIYFDPCDYGDAWTKRTALWGEFTAPPKNRVAPILNPAPGSSPIHRMPPGPLRQALRSITPAGFARAFFEANP